MFPANDAVDAAGAPCVVDEETACCAAASGTVTSAWAWAWAALPIPAGASVATRAAAAVEVPAGVGPPPTPVNAAMPAAPAPPTVAVPPAPPASSCRICTCPCGSGRPTSATRRVGGCAAGPAGAGGCTDRPAPIQGRTVPSLFGPGAPRTGVGAVVARGRGELLPTGVSAVRASGAAAMVGEGPGTEESRASAGARMASSANTGSAPDVSASVAWGASVAWVASVATAEPSATAVAAAARLHARCAAIIGVEGSIGLGESAPRFASPAVCTSFTACAAGAPSRPTCGLRHPEPAGATPWAPAGCAALRPESGEAAGAPAGTRLIWLPPDGGPGRPPPGGCAADLARCAA